MKEPQLLYVDNHLLALEKPAGMLAQGDRTGDPTLLEWGKEYVKKRFKKPGNVFLGLVHRLDRPTSGVMVFARTSKAASRLSAQFRARTPLKIYSALVEGKVPSEGTLVDHVERRANGTTVATNDGGKIAKLSFQRREFRKNTSWISVELATGRHHQIRVQFSHLGHPIIGDLRYGSKREFTNSTLALHATSITLRHPVKDEQITFNADPPPYWHSYYREL